MTNSDKQALLEIARRELLRAVESGSSSDRAGDNVGDNVADDLPEGTSSGLPADAAPLKAGAFVTLRARGRLRGCIGQLGSERPVAEVVAYCARAAARQDPRFTPVRAEELGETEIEISV